MLTQTLIQASAPPAGEKYGVKVPQVEQGPSQSSTRPTAVKVSPVTAKAPFASKLTITPGWNRTSNLRIRRHDETTAELRHFPRDFGHFSRIFRHRNLVQTCALSRV